MHSEDEEFRGTVQAQDLDGGAHTIIVMRRGTGSARVWLTLNGAWKTTVQMTDAKAARLAELLTQAQRKA